jgi:hypothetical protein
VLFCLDGVVGSVCRQPKNKYLSFGHAHSHNTKKHCVDACVGEGVRSSRQYDGRMMIMQVNL